MDEKEFSKKYFFYIKIFNLQLIKYKNNFKASFKVVPKKTVEINDFTLLKRLGNGKFATVFLGIHNVNKCLFAIK